MGLGGAEKQIVELANGLLGKGFGIAVLIFDTRGDKCFRIKDLRQEICLIQPSLKPDHPVISLRRGICETVKAVWQWKPDFLYSRLWNTNPFAVAVGKFFGAKVILGVSNSEMHEVERKKNKTFTKFYRKNIYGLADLVIAVSEDLAREVEDLYKLTSVKTVYNGIDIEDIRTKSNAPPPHEYFQGDFPILVSAGRLAPQKEYKHLLEAFAVVNETVEARLVMVGEGELKDELVRTAQALGVHGKTAMVGQRESYPYIRHGDVFVSSSLHEGMPNAILEAMALGTPVVSTDCDYGPREIIEHGKNGLLVPVSNPTKLASAVLMLIQNRKLRLNIAAEAEKRAQYFTSDKMISDYEKIFANMRT